MSRKYLSTSNILVNPLLFGVGVCVELQVKPGGARRSGDYQIVYKDNVLKKSNQRGGVFF